MGFLKRVLFVSSASLLFLSCGGGGGGTPSAASSGPSTPPPPASTDNLYLRLIQGKLPISSTASTPTYQAYFLIPIAFEEQAPILFTLTSPQLIDYRFLRLGPDNVIVAAQLRSGPTTLNWESWVIVKDQDLTSRPTTVPLSAYSNLTPDLLALLQPTDCVQVNDPFVRSYAKNVAGSASDLWSLTKTVANKCGHIPYDFKRTPVSFDAYYSMKWDNSCTGHAHAGAALLRAEGVPTRVLLNMPTWTSTAYDQHWIIQYWVPGYRWVRMETTMGLDMKTPQDEIVSMVCAPEDEFPVFYTNGIEGYWHTSDPRLPMTNPDWARAHLGSDIQTFAIGQPLSTQAVAVAADMFRAEVDHRGRCPGAAASQTIQSAQSLQTQALAQLRSQDVQGCIKSLQDALALYNSIPQKPESRVFFEDFEQGENGWTHGGTHDSWEMGSPVAGDKPGMAHSGLHCMGNGFNGGYPNLADSWLLSPGMDLSNLNSATLSFWLYDWVGSPSPYSLQDPLWVELSTDDGQTFQPICSQMGGVNGDSAIPAVGGWAHLHLDLTPFVGSSHVRVRFHFQSASGVSNPGCYLDDIEVVGRPI